MFDLLGWGELVLILVVALIIVGPHDLPKVLYTLGRWLHALKQTAESFKIELEGLSRLDKLQDLHRDKEKKDNEDVNKKLPSSG